MDHIKYGSDQFLSINNNEVHHNYYDLCEKNQCLGSYLANPLLFILVNKPKCCLKYALKFIEIDDVGSYQKFIEGRYYDKVKMT